jgi:hypothetical protein
MEYKLVNFSETHELDYQLEKVNKSKSEYNREKLIMMGNVLKSIKNVKYLEHDEFYSFINTPRNLRTLKDPVKTSA